MKRVHRRELLKITLLFTTLSLFLPRSEAFFFNLAGMSNCGGCPSLPPCCPMQQPSSSGFGSQLFSSYGVGRMFGPAGGGRYAVAPPAGNAYPVPPAHHPWAAQMHQHLAQHMATAHQQWSAHQYSMMPSYASLPAAQPVASIPTAGYMESTTPETTTTVEEASFFGDSNRVVDEVPSPPPSPFSEQIDEEPTTMYSTDQTREPLRETPSGYSFTAAPAAAPPPDSTWDRPAPPPEDSWSAAATTSWSATPATEAPIQVESAASQKEIGSYFRSKPPKVLPAATQAVNEFSATATWSPATTVAWAASADTRPPLIAFSADAAPATVQQSAPTPPPAAAAVPGAAPQIQQQPDLTSEEVKELDDLDMLLITSDASFRPVTSQNPARPLTSEERAGFTSNDISTIADGLPPNLSDVIFWPIGKDLTLLKRAIALRRRRDEEARRRMLRSSKGAYPPSGQKHRSEPQMKRVPSTDERVSSFLAHYFRRRSPSGDSRRVVSGGESERTGRRLRSAKSARDILRSSILEKILAMEELLAET